MKARVFKVFKNNNHKIKITYVDAAKFHDDVESCTHTYVCTPMMEIRLFTSKDSLDEERLVCFASPELIKEYTGFDMFNADYSYSIEGKVLDIEFDFVEEMYPYLKPNDKRDKVLSNKYKYPRIQKIEKPEITFD